MGHEGTCSRFSMFKWGLGFVLRFCKYVCRCPRYDWSLALFSWYPTCPPLPYSFQLRRCYFPFGSSIGVGPCQPDKEKYVRNMLGYPSQWKSSTKYKNDHIHLGHRNLTYWIYICWCPSVTQGAGYPELDLLVVVDTPAGAPAQTQHRDTILPGPCASLGVHIPLTCMQAQTRRSPFACAVLSIDGYRMIWDNMGWYRHRSMNPTLVLYKHLYIYI